VLATPKEEEGKRSFDLGRSEIFGAWKNNNNDLNEIFLFGAMDGFSYA
jgi:hypothetical protein